MTTRKFIPLAFHFAKDNERAAKRPLIFFVHHFGGSSTSSKRHVNAVNDLGFDAVTFSLSWHGEQKRRAVPVYLSHSWKNEIRQALNQLGQERKKITFSFSGPSAPTLAVVAERLKEGARAGTNSDVVASICDSGPFLDAWFCTRRMIEQVYGITKPLQREALLTSMMMVWGPGHNRRLLRSIAQIAKYKSNYPILSIRGDLDTIVPPDKIAAAFAQSELKALAVYDVNAGHLTGLRDKGLEYKAQLKSFLAPWI